MTEERRRKIRSKERERRRIILLPTFGLNRDERTEGRLEINIIKFALRCVTIAQSFFYSFSHHFVNFLFPLSLVLQTTTTITTFNETPLFVLVLFRATRIRTDFSFLTFIRRRYLFRLFLSLPFSFSHPCDEQHLFLFITRMYTHI